MGAGTKAEGGVRVGGGADSRVGCRAFQISRSGPSVRYPGHPLASGPSLVPTSAKPRR